MNAPKGEVWTLLFDTDTLLNSIPGCKEIEKVGQDEYKGVCVIGIAGFRGSYGTYVRVHDINEPHYCEFECEVTGAGGKVECDVSVNLEDKNQKTLIGYEGQASVSGALSKINPWIIERVARSLLKRGFKKFNKNLQFA